MSTRIYIKGRMPQKRLKNLKKVAEKYHRGNFSEMMNIAINEKYNLDPETGRELTTRKSKSK